MTPAAGPDRTVCTGCRTHVAALVTMLPIAPPAKSSVTTMFAAAVGLFAARFLAATECRCRPREIGPSLVLLSVLLVTPEPAVANVAYAEEAALGVGDHCLLAGRNRAFKGERYMCRANDGSVVVGDGSADGAGGLR